MHSLRNLNDSHKYLVIFLGDGLWLMGNADTSCPLNISLSEKNFVLVLLVLDFRRKSIGRKGIFTLKFRKHGCTELRKVASE